ncbi:MAG: sigma 54-interacting transcriptional regulator [Deltaproteobacteria bacterium]|nr:sigma 54-interacting transcriptional regulator [Deltaproteobacteria bacterium]MBN2674650.1 sigma 54-interacting transcriptional regulator [Deltaproteobacteria bacterium]
MELKVPLNEIKTDIQSTEFLQSLFNAIPCGVMVMDSERRVKMVNDAMQVGFGEGKATLHDQLGGDILHCINAAATPAGCGHSTECSHCKIRESAQSAIFGNQVSRLHTEVYVKDGDQTRERQIMISASPFVHDEKKMAIVLLEDISELTALRNRLKAIHSFAGIIGKDPQMCELFETIKEVADINVPIHIYGKSGTGKELVASAIHNEGVRANMPFVPVNCAALPEGVLESELFGHVRGAFTGAIRDKRGRFELADGGTLFLDEVAEMPKLLQAKLLRVLQEGRFERVGDEKSITVDVRIISATNKNLKEEVEKGEFREDLYYRLNVVPVEIPSLSERPGDIPLLVESFLKRAKETGQTSLGVSTEAMSLFLEYPWPGNVRELQSVIQFALIKARGGIIEPGHLSPQFKAWFEENKGQSFPARPSQMPAAATAKPSKTLTPVNIDAALEQTGGNKAKAAKLLGVGRATLYRYLDARK